MRAKVMKRAHKLAKQMKGDYQARLKLGLQIAWEEEREMKFHGLTEDAIREFGNFEEDEELTQDKIDFAWEEFHRTLKSRPTSDPQYYFQFLSQLRDLELNFGKHKGKSLSEIYEQDRNYFRWVKQEFSSNHLGYIAKQVQDNIRDEQELDDDELLI